MMVTSAVAQSAPRFRLDCRVCTSVWPSHESKSCHRDSSRTHFKPLRFDTSSALSLARCRYRSALDPKELLLCNRVHDATGECSDGSGDAAGSDLRLDQPRVLTVRGELERSIQAVTPCRFKCCGTHADSVSLQTTSGIGGADWFFVSLSPFPSFTSRGSGAFLVRRFQRRDFLKPGQVSTRVMRVRRSLGSALAMKSVVRFLREFLVLLLHRIGRPFRDGPL